jgi:type IX secretion system substrate protein
MKHKFFTLFFTVAVIYMNAFGQPVITGQVVSGGSADDYFTSMYLTKDKGLIAGGSSSSNISADKTQDSRGLEDYWIVKYDKHGKIQWDKTIGGGDFDYLASIEQTKDSGYILGGSSSSNKSGEKTEDSRGSQDMWIVKLNKAGQIQWDKTTGGSDFDYLASIEQTSDGGYIFGGSSNSNKSGDKTQNSRGRADYWVLKTDNAGNIQWQRTIGGSDDDQLTAVHQTSDGGYVLGGYSDSDSSGEKTGNNKCNCHGVAYSWDYWIVKLNSKGQIQWDKTIGGNNTDGWNTIEQTRDGGYVVGGISSSNASGDKTQNSKGASDYWIVKLDNNGNKQWDKTIGGSSYDGNSSFSIQQTKDGGYVMASESYSNKSGDKTENNICPGCHDDFGDPYFDYWVVKTDNTGNIQWDKTIGGTYDDICNAVKEVRENVYVVGGYSASGISGNKTIDTKGGEDYWIVKLNYTDTTTRVIASLNNSNIKIPANSNNKIAIYPNPVKDMLHIQNAGKTSVFTLTNAFGKVVITQEITGSGSINIAQLPSGAYFIKDNSTSITQKIIVAE